MAAPEPSESERMAAAISLAGLAAQFITEPETYPIFLTWLSKRHPSVDSVPRWSRSRAEARRLADGFLMVSLHLLKVVNGSDPS
jgi:hypothetical protein